MTDMGWQQESGSLGPRSIGVTSLPIIRTCQRRVALAKFGSPNEQLPSTHPFAVLGTLHHDFLERVGRGDAGNPPNDDDFPKLWEHCIERVESRLTDKPDSVWLPIAVTIDDIERAKLRAFRAASNIRVFARQESPERLSARRRGPELSVTHLVEGIELRGKIDMVLEKSRVIQIIDYKTGSVHDHDGAVKPEYAEQLRIYAGLFAITTGERAGELTVIDQRGQEHSVDCGLDRIAESLDAAIDTVRDFASKWPINAQEDRDILNAYKATPSDDICGSCRVRHRCDSHIVRMAKEGRVSLRSVGSNSKSADLYGQVESLSKISIGWAIKLCSPIGHVHLRGFINHIPAKGMKAYAYGVVPSLAHTPPGADMPTDYVIPRWGRVHMTPDAIHPLHAFGLGD